MLSENSSLDSKVVVENEKQVVTISNGASSASGKTTITVEKEREILDEIEKHCSNWRKIGNVYIACIIVFGLAAVSTSVMVSIYTGSDERIMQVSTIKIMACISTISLGVLTAFNLVTNANNARNAWKSLNAALMLYAAGSITLQQLIEHYQKGESQLGSLSFNYGTNTDKGTYAHDIVASAEERKQREAAEEIKKQKEAETPPKGVYHDAERPLNGTKLAPGHVDNVVLKE